MGRGGGRAPPKFLQSGKNQCEIRAKHGQYNLQTADCRPDWVQNADWGYKMQTEDKMQTGGELGIFYKFPPSHSHVIVLVDILMLKLDSHFHQNGQRRQRCRGIDII